MLQKPSPLDLTLLCHVLFCLFDVVLIPSVRLSKLYLTGAVYSLDGSDSLKDTMQTSVNYPQQVCEPPWVQNPNPKDKTRPLEILVWFLGSCSSTVLIPEALQTTDFTPSHMWLQLFIACAFPLPYIDVFIFAE